MSKTVQIRLSDELYEFISRAAQADDRKVANYIVNVLNQHRRAAEGGSVRPAQVAKPAQGSPAGFNQGDEPDF